MVVLATPDTQLTVTVPPLELVAIESPNKGEIRVKAPPVELDIVATTLVALMVRASATEPVAIVREILGDERKTSAAFA